MSDICSEFEIQLIVWSSRQKSIKSSGFLRKLMSSTDSRFTNLLHFRMYYTLEKPLCVASRQYFESATLTGCIIHSKESLCWQVVALLNIHVWPLLNLLTQCHFWKSPSCICLLQSHRLQKFIRFFTDHQWIRIPVILVTIIDRWGFLNYPI